jgi:hypothetical protein
VEVVDIVEAPASKAEEDDTEWHQLIDENNR